MKSRNFIYSAIPCASLLPLAWRLLAEPLPAMETGGFRLSERVRFVPGTGRPTRPAKLKGFGRRLQRPFLPPWKGARAIPSPGVDENAALHQLITHHSPARTARTKKRPLLSTLTFRKPLAKSTNQAPVGSMAPDVDDQ